AHIHLSDPPNRLGNNGNGTVEKRDVGGGGVIIKNGRYQKHGQNEAARNAPPKLEPNRVKSNLLAEPLSLRIAAIKIVRQKRHQRAKKHLKHGRALSCR